MNFTELEVWKKGRELRNEIFHLSKSFPSSKKFSLIDQVMRSSRSVTANIAEGHGRYHYKENIQFCRMSRGSLAETLDHLICAFDCDYIEESVLNDFQEKIEEVNRILNGYIGYLKSQLDR